MADRLADAKSAYLRTATESPIDWWPWSEAAFQKAKEEDKPVLLDIGAVWCHWCHVMDHKTYEHPEVVKRLAEDFVCIKVDRDERPDVDMRYQQAVSAISGQGGWPLTAFLTPEGRVFYGGTYFPPEDAHGRAGFPKVLEQIAHVFSHDRQKAEDSALHIAEELRRHLTVEPSDQTLDPDILKEVPKRLVKRFDPRYGGFGDAPKFPHTGAVLLAMQRYLATGDDQLEMVVRRTCDKMAAGGIHDHVEGGFHRYSVDAHWTVPHFEKMAYDNAELLRVYARAAVALDEPRYKAVAEDILHWFARYSPDDGFLASQDADIGPEDDGDHFTWTLDETDAAMKDEEAIATRPDAAKDLDPTFLFEVARRRFGIEARGDMHHDPARNVLEHEMSHDEIAEALETDVAKVARAEAEILRRLGMVRDRRKRPFVDTTRFTDWTAMCVSAAFEAGALLDDEAATTRAQKTLDRLIAGSWNDDKGWLHRPRDDGGDEANGMLDDQAWAGVALVDAYRYTGRTDYLHHAERTAARLVDHWLAEDGQGFVDTADWIRAKPTAAPLGEPLKPYMDQGSPGGNAVAAQFLARLARATGKERYLDTARRTVAAFVRTAPEAGIFAATWTLAFEEIVKEPPVVTVFGYGDEAPTQEQLATARRVPRAGVVVHHAEPNAAPEGVPEAVAHVLDNEDMIKDGPVTLVCHGDHCGAPMRDLDQIVLSIRDDPLGRKDDTASAETTL